MTTDLQPARRLALKAQDARPALNEAATAAPAMGGGISIALASEGAAPEWVQLLPRGPLIAGRDGRKFYLNDPAAVVAATQPHLPLVIDFEHASELGGVDAKPAAGWIEALEVRNGGVWGKASWTGKAANMIRDREYRFVSPAFYHVQPPRDAEIIQLCSIGLVHKPNLELKALNARTPQEPNMLKEILIALGLAEDKTAVDAVAAINALKAEKSVALNAAENPPLAKFVPAAQHEETVKALNAANAKLDAAAKAAAESAATTLIEDAMKAGKIAPAAKDHFVKMALNSFDATKAAIDAMPSIIKPGEAPETKRAPDPATGALTDQQKAVCANLGMSEADYAKSLAARAA